MLNHHTPTGIPTSHSVSGSKGAFRLLGPVITWMGSRQEQRIWTSLKKHLEAAAAA
jgi:hypothetical protein